MSQNPFSPKGATSLLDEAISNLQSLETIDGFGNESVQKFSIEAERLQAGINRYVSEHVGNEADQDCARLDKLLAPEPTSEEPRENRESRK